MGRSAALLVGVLGLGVAGCSASAGSPGGSGESLVEPSVSAVAEAPAFHFESGDLPLGEFDPATVGGNLFNPCAEISEEEFAAMGLVKKTIDFGTDAELGTGGCYFSIGNRDRSLGLVSVAASREIAAANPRVLFYAESGDVPNAYVFRFSGNESDCYALVDTVRGAVGVNATSALPDDGEDELCPIALDGLTSLYALDGQ